MRRRDAGNCGGAEGKHTCPQVLLRISFLKVHTLVEPLANCADSTSAKAQDVWIRTVMKLRIHLHPQTNTQNSRAYKYIKWYLRKHLFCRILVKLGHLSLTHTQAHKHHPRFPDELILTSVLLETEKRLTCCFYCLIGSHARKHTQTHTQT